MGEWEMTSQRDYRGNDRGDWQGSRNEVGSDRGPENRSYPSDYDTYPDRASNRPYEGNQGNYGSQGDFYQGDGRDFGRNYGWNARGYNTEPNSYYGGGNSGRGNYDPGYGSSYGGSGARPYYGPDRSPDYSGRNEYYGNTGNTGNTGNYGMGGESSGRTQNHAGRGPRNYQRSDERIRDDVNEELTRHPGLDASDLDVRVNNGEVTLTGTVDNRSAKRMAEDAAESCSGVRDVHNQIRISSAEASSSRGAKADREVPRQTERESHASGASGSHQGSTAASDNETSRGKTGNKTTSTTASAT